jgi:hypothetical protein
MTTTAPGVPGRHGGDDAGGLAAHGAPGGHAHGRGDAQVVVPVVAVEQVGHPADRLDGQGELGPVGERPGRPDLRDRGGPQLLDVTLEALLELADAPLPERRVGRPPRVVERPAGGGDGPVGVGGRPVGAHADHLPRRGRQVVEHGPVGRLDEPSVDAHPLFTPQRLSHVLPLRPPAVEL